MNLFQPPEMTSHRMILGLAYDVAGKRMLAFNEAGTVVVYYTGIAYNNSSRPSICLSAYNFESGTSERLISFDANDIRIIGRDADSSRLYIVEEYGNSTWGFQYNLGYYDTRNSPYGDCFEEPGYVAR